MYDLPEQQLDFKVLARLNSDMKVFYTKHINRNFHCEVKAMMG